jgi:hypothetical protein
MFFVNQNLFVEAFHQRNEKVDAWGRLPEAAVRALGLNRGDFTHG